MSPQQLGGAAKHVCWNLIVKKCINSRIVCPFFLFFLLQKLLDRVWRKWANPSLKDDDASARMMSRVCNNINQTVVLNIPLWFMLLQTQRLSEGTNTNKSLCRTPLKRKKKDFSSTFFSPPCFDHFSLVCGERLRYRRCSQIFVWRLIGFWGKKHSEDGKEKRGRKKRDDTNFSCPP